MPSPETATSTLVERARMLRLDACRIRNRSVALMTQRLTIMRASAIAHEQFAAVRVARLRWQRLTQGCWIGNIRPLPLDPPKLLELADEFRQLAARAATLASSTAFHHLAFRYTALAH